MFNCQASTTGKFKMVETSKPWTWEELKLVSDLASKGFTAKNIALELIGRNKNSVIGICHRRGIKLLQRTIQKEKPYLPLSNKEREKKKQPNYNINKPKKVRLPPIKVLETHKDENFVPLYKTLEDLRYFECKAIVGPIKNMETPYCGHPVVAGKSWCPYHFKIYTVPSKSRAA
jgi:hypothetical protein